MFIATVIVEWTEEEKALLVKNVEMVPVLWQPTHPLNSKRGPRDAAHKISKLFPGRGKTCFWSDSTATGLGSRNGLRTVRYAVILFLKLSSQNQDLPLAMYIVNG
jgi:hypothetical protein